MDNNSNTVHETVEDKIVKKTSEAVSENDSSEIVSDTNKERDSVDRKSSEESKMDKDQDKEGLTDEDVIDINEETSDKKADSSKKTEGPLQEKTSRRKSPKTTEDFIKKQKKRKRTKTIVILAVIALIVVAGFLYIRKTMNDAKKKLEEMTAAKIETALVEKKTLYDSKDATGTLYSLESRTISTILQQSNGGAKIDKVNVEVGDHVTAGDVLVEFSTENIQKTISETKEDISTQRQQDAIDAADAQRNYVYSYSNAASDIQTAAKNVDQALFDLHEACDAYGDAKRNREKYMEEHDSSTAQLDAAVDSAFQAQEKAQKAYDAAVETQAKTINSTQAQSLSNADSTYQKSQITSGQQVKKYQRTLEELNDSLEDYVVYATIDGIVTEVNVSEGNRFQSGNVVTIQDDSGYKAEVLIDEYDIPKVKKAYNKAKEEGGELQVVVKTEATGDEEYKGHVTLIAPTSTSTTSFSTTTSASAGGVTTTASSSSTANYKVTIELDDIDDAFMIGMSAKVAIVVDQSPDNALCVPYNCVEETDDGKYIIKVMDANGDHSTSETSFPMGPQGDKNSNDSEKPDSASESKGVNGIVIENNSNSADRPDSPKDNKKGFLSKLFSNGDEERVDTGRRYREVEVDKIFDTDYYASVVPKKEGSLKEGDEVLVVSEKADGNDIMSMFGGGMGGGPGDGPGGF